MTDYNINDYLADIDESIEQASTPPGIAAAKATVEFGFPIFISGLTADERFFPALPGGRNKDSQEKAFAEAMKAAKEHDPEYSGKPRFSLQVTFHADGAKKIQDGDLVDAGWRGDLSEVEPLWTASAKNRETGEPLPSMLREYHLPALRGNEIMHGQTVWCLIGITDDPYKVSLGDAGKTDEYEGEQRFPTKRYISQVFDSAQAAYAALSGGSASAASGNFPPEYGSETAWKKVAKMIEKDLDGGMSVDEACEKYEVEASYVEELIVP